MEMRVVATRHVAKEIKIIVKVSDINRETHFDTRHAHCSQTLKVITSSF